MRIIVAVERIRNTKSHYFVAGEVNLEVCNLAFRQEGN